MGRRGALDGAAGDRAGEAPALVAGQALLAPRRLVALPADRPALLPLRQAVAHDPLDARVRADRRRAGDLAGDDDRDAAQLREGALHGLARLGA